MPLKSDILSLIANARVHGCVRSFDARRILLTTLPITQLHRSHEVGAAHRIEPCHLVDIDRVLHHLLNCATQTPLPTPTVVALYDHAPGRCMNIIQKSPNHHSPLPTERNVKRHMWESCIAFPEVLNVHRALPSTARRTEPEKACPNGERAPDSAPSQYVRSTHRAAQGAELLQFSSRHSEFGSAARSSWHTCQPRSSVRSEAGAR